MTSFYEIRIQFDASIDTFNFLTKILGVNPSVNNFQDTKPNSWTYSIVKDNSDPYFDFINNFLDILEGKYSEIEKVGIQRGDISFWYLYEYNQQCNIEFDSPRLKRLGDQGISMCISCWDSGNENVDIDNC